MYIFVINVDLPKKVYKYDNDNPVFASWFFAGPARNMF